MSAQVLKRPFTVDEYHRMAEAGILSEDDRVELIEGEILEMTPIGSPHASCVNRMAQLLYERMAGGAILSVQNPIRLGEHSEPQPDLALLRRRDDYYASSHPGPEDIFLVIEVADTSAVYDRDVKVNLYARWGITEAWLVDLEQGAIEVYSRPSAQGYQEIRKARPGQRLSPGALPALELDVGEVLR